MLQNLLDILANSSSDITKTKICRELNISPARLDNMLLVLEQKGKIRQVADNHLCEDTAHCPSTGKSCPGPSNCLLIIEMPLGIEVITGE